MEYNVLHPSQFTFAKRLFLVLMLVSCIYTLHAIDIESTSHMIVCAILTGVFLLLFLWTASLQYVAKQYHEIIGYYKSKLVSEEGKDELVKHWYADNEKLIKSSGIKPSAN